MRKLGKQEKMRPVPREALSELPMRTNFAIPLRIDESGNHESRKTADYADVTDISSAISSHKVHYGHEHP